MGKKSKFALDPKAFLATVDGGRTVSDYRKDLACCLLARQLRRRCRPMAPQSLVSGSKLTLWLP